MRLFKILAINAAILIALLFVLEFSLATILGPVYLRSDPQWIPDGHTKGRFLPNSTIEGAGGHNVLNPILRQEPARYALNELGFRGTDWDFDAPASTVFFGASSTFNFHDVDADTWPFLVNACLSAKRDRDLQYVNLSQPGYSVENAPHLYLQIARHLNPEHIFIYHAWNDLKFVSRFAKDRKRQFFSGVSQSKWSLKTFLLDLGIFPNIIQRTNMILRSNAASENYYEKADIDADDIAFAVDFMKHNYEALFQLAGEEHRIYVIKQGLYLEGNELPAQEKVLFDLQGMTRSQFRTAVAAYFSMLDDLAATYPQVQVIDADAALPKTIEVFEDHVHLQRKGNRLLAEIICSKL